MDRQGESGLVWWIGFGCGVLVAVVIWFVVSFVRIEL